MGSSALGLGALLLCLRGSRRAVTGAVVVLLVSLTFSGISITFVLGCVLALLVERRWRSAVLTAATTGITYLTWYVLIGHTATIPEHTAGRLTRAAGAADWAWSVFTSAAGVYTSAKVLGPVLVAALVAFFVAHALRTRSERDGSSREAHRRFTVLTVCTATTVLQVVSFAVNRSDISPADSPGYLYYVIALLLPLLAVALTALRRVTGPAVTAALLIYLVLTQAVVLVAQERQFENPQIRADALGIGRLVADGEPVNQVSLFADVTTASISRWVAQGALGQLADVDPRFVLDARAIAQVAVLDAQPAVAAAADIQVSGSSASLGSGSCSTVTTSPGGVAAELTLDPGSTVQVRVEDANSLVYRVVQDGVSSRTVGTTVGADTDHWMTATVETRVQVVADSGQTIRFCLP